MGRLLEAEGMLINKQRLDDLGNGTYQLNHTLPFTVYEPAAEEIHATMCQDSIFYGQTQVSESGTGRSGFLVGPNIFVTAPHTPDFDPTQYYIVFGLSAGGYHTTCNTIVNTIIPASNVYEADPNSTIYNTLTQPTLPYLPPDYMAFYLDRTVSNRRWLRMRSSGVPSKDDSIAIAGHPERLYTKLEYGVTYNGAYGQQTSDIDPSVPMFFNFHIDDASSGSPVFNLSKGVVETAVRGTTAATNHGVEQDGYGVCNTNFYQNGGITLADSYSVNALHPPKPDALNTGKIEYFSQLVPTLEPRLSPLQDSTYVLPVGTAATTPSISYTLKASSAGSTIFADANVLPPPSGQPALLVGGPMLPYFGNLSAGQSTNLSVSTNVPSTLSCGVYDRFLQVDAGGFTDLVRHRFEIGLKEVAITPMDTYEVNDLAAPYPTRTYTIRNVRPTPTTVSLNPGAYGSSTTLLLINGGGGINISLAAAGDPAGNDVKTFTIGVKPNIDSATIAGTVYHEFVSVNQVDQICTRQTQFFLNVDFKRGEQIFVSGTAGVPLQGPSSGNTYGPPLRFDFDLTNEQASCVQNVDVDLGFATGLAGVQYTKLQLTSPSNTTGILWDRETLPPDDYDVTDVVDGYGSVNMFHLDDSTSPPLGPDPLSTFSSGSINGHWYLDVSSSTNSQLIIPGPARLNITKRASCVASGK
jgi:hypothetical protein